MTAAAEVLVDAFGRVREVVEEVVDGLTPDELAFRPDGQANSIAWLIWHLTRVQDDHVADVAETEQVWTAGGWATRFALPFDALATGYGHTSTSRRSGSSRASRTRTWSGSSTSSGIRPSRCGCGS
jgi:hypothetical protein